MTSTAEISTRIPAIRTRYNGVSYRSRLEARWAAMFTLLGWPCDYEPVDLRGYIPDFILTFTEGPVLVEVKPAMYRHELPSHFSKIVESGWEREAIVVGARLFETLEYQSTDTFGAVIGTFATNGDDATVGQHPDCCDDWDRVHYGLSSDLLSYHCRVCGRNDSVAVGCYGAPPLTSRSVHDLWSEAGNLVQWRPGA